MLVLLLAGCGKDDDTESADDSGSTQTTRSTTTGAGGNDADGGTSTAGGSRSVLGDTGDGSGSGGGSGSAGSGSRTTGSGASRTTTSGSSASGATGSGSNGSSGGGASSPGSGSGSGSPAAGEGPRDDRVAAAAAARRYVTAFIDSDGPEACALATAAHRQDIIAVGGGDNCEDSLRRVRGRITPSQLTLVEKQRDGIDAADVGVDGARATIQVGVGREMRLVLQDGDWLVDEEIA